MDSMSSQGTDASDATNANRIGVLVVVINAMTMVWPLVRKILVGKHVEYYEKVVWMLGFPHRCYMSYCGGEKRAAAARAKAKEARAARRRSAGIRRQATAGDEAWGEFGLQGDRSLGMSPRRWQQLQPDIETGDSVAPQEVSIAPAVAVLGYMGPQSLGDNKRDVDRDAVLHEVWERCEGYSRDQFFRKLSEMGYREHAHVGPDNDQSFGDFSALGYDEFFDNFTALGYTEHIEEDNGQLVDHGQGVGSQGVRGGRGDAGRGGAAAQ